jgi:cytochrome c oxidase assembly protein subunit 15
MFARDESAIVAANSVASVALHRFAVVCAAATFVLIFVGGLVTSTGSALAVPDWPLAFGRLIPELAGGVRFEWGHRVVAGVVSVLTLILAVWTWRVETRRWVRINALAAFGMIVVQAILGGITVLWLLPLLIAVAHAATAQAFFCLIVALAVVTNRRFTGASNSANDPLRPRLRTLAMVTTAIIYAQILIGAVMRHLGAGLAIPDFPTSFGRLVPPFISIYVTINFAHRCGAVVVAWFVIWTVERVLRFHRRDSALRGPAVGLFVLLMLQVILGALTIWSGRAVLPTTAHVALGAAVLATSLTLAMRTYTSGNLAALAQPDRVPAPMMNTIERKVTA